MNPFFRQFILQRVWETVNNDYIYPDFNTLDWPATKQKYQQKIKKVETNEAFYKTLDDMILELNDDHSIYFSPWDTCAEDSYYDNPHSDEILQVKRLSSNPTVILLDFNNFDAYDLADTLTLDLREVLRDGDVTGIIVDLRQNPGGLLTVAYDVLSQFVNGQLGLEYSQTDSYPVVASRGLYYYRFKDLPVVVLVDHETHSAAEIVAAVLQAERHATVVGVTSAGNTEVLEPFDFVDGSRLWLAVGGFTLLNGTNLEGRGVIPDIPISVLDIDNDELILGKALEFLGILQSQKQP